METSRAAAPPLEDSNTAGILIYSMVSTDLVTRGLRPPYTPVTILVTDDRPDDTVLCDCAWTVRGPERHVAGAAHCSA